MSSGEPLSPEAFRALLGRGASPFGLELSTESQEALASYLAELDRWRRRVNLTGPMSARELVSHALESALGAPMLPAGARVIDVGSGAGFPGLPLAIVRPDLAVTLLEPRGKRASFLRHAGRALALPNLLVLEESVERLEVPAWSAATSRAVGRLASILGPASFLTPGGTLLAWTTRGTELAGELAPVFALVRLQPVPGSRKRAILLFRKVDPDVPRGTSGNGVQLE